MYPLLNVDDNYMMEGIDVAHRAGLENETTLQEIKEYIVDKNNYLSKEKKLQMRQIIKMIRWVVEIYWELEKNNLINRYKSKIVSQLNEIEIDNPSFYLDFNKHTGEWIDKISKK